jgi:hypothetical protein
MDARKLCHVGRDDVTTLILRCQRDLFSDTGARMQAVFAILTIVLLAACADGGLSPLPNDQIHVRFPAGGVVDVIEVDAVNRLPLRKAELVAPDGQTTPASYINVTPSPSSTSYEELPNDPYAGLGVGNVAPSVPLPAVTGGAPQQRATLLAMISSASIPLPDPVEYRRDWRNYRIRLSFRDAPGGVETREVDAPAPPPGQ